MSTDTQANTRDRPLVAAIDAAIEQCQTAIRRLMEARRIAVQQYDEHDIDTAIDDEWCTVCGPACICELRAAVTP